MAETKQTPDIPVEETELNLSSFDFQQQLELLNRQKADLLHRKKVADHFSQTAQRKLDEIDEQIFIIKGFLGEKDTNVIKPPEVFDDKTNERFPLNPTPKKFEPRLIVKGKSEEEAENEETEKKEKEAATQQAQQARPNQPQQPRTPPQPDQPQQPQQPQELTPAERLEQIRQKLTQRDPRKQKEGLEELKKPENKELGKDDPVFQKLQKNAEKRVQRFDKIRESLRKNLKTLMQSDSEVVKKNLDHIRAGRIGMGMAGMKEIGKTTDPRFNDVAKAAKGLFENVSALYKEFDIKPEEALSREALNEAKPTFTRQMGFKSKEDKDIDRNSRQNRWLGQSNELSEEERHTYKKIKDIYGVEVDKLPPVDAQTQKDMWIIREIVKETAQTTTTKIKPALLMQSGGNSL